MKEAKFGKDTYELSIGNSLLKGKLTNLEKPLLFTQKMRNEEVSYEIKGIIRQKLVFNTRPTPLRNNAQNVRNNN